MTPAGPRPLAENAALVFVGEKPWSPAVVTTARAQDIEAARNPTGRPNRDVLRHFIGCKADRPRGHQQIDFPSHFSAPEAALYLKPCQQLRSRLNDPSGAWWLNPHANPELRLSLARATRSGETAQLNAAAATVYGWPAALTDDDVLARLTELNRQRTPAGL